MLTGKTFFLLFCSTKNISENSCILAYICMCSVMFQKLAENGRQYEAETKAHIQKYAEAGLRTLVIAYRELDEEVYKRWEEEFAKAKTSVSEDREALVERTAEKIERGLILLGATAVEDKLQKGVSVIYKTYFLNWNLFHFFIFIFYI